MKRQPSGSNARPELKPRLTRAAWFAGLWLAGVLSLGIVVYALRWAIKL
jgi:hypothetical protein